MKYKPAPRGKRLFEGFYFNANWQDWQCALYLFGTTRQGEDKLRFWKLWVQTCWPDPVFIWDVWADLSFGALCGAKETVERVIGKTFHTEHKWWECVIFTGAASTGKSARAAMWILGNWLVAQEHTAAILSSTSVDLLSKRIWADILTWIDTAAVKFPLRSVPSDLELRWNDSDRKHAVFGVAVKSGGNPTEAAHRIHGIHARRTFMVCDEMPSVAKAIVDASRNIRIGTDETQFIGLGNASSKTDPHGERCEPVDGWNSITDADQFWITRLGCCVHLDARLSPGLTDPKRFHFYPKQEDMDRDAREMGGANSPLFWSYIIGFWAPTGLTNFVMDEALFDQFHCRDDALWKRLWTVGGAGDPAFEGGDRRVFYPFRWGEFANGITGVELLDPQLIEVDMSQDKRWIHYQVADGYQRACEQFKIDGKPFPIAPENFIMDVTGEGGGIYSIMSGRWSPLIKAVEFGGAPEKTQIAPDRPTTWYELYRNKVTMLYYAFRRFVEGGQIRGLTHSQTIKELVSRDKKMMGGKIMLLSKAEAKKILGRSPDFGDGAVLISEFLRRQGVTPAGKTGGGESVSLKEWDAWAAKANLSDEENDYADSGAAFA